MISILFMVTMSFLGAPRSCRGSAGMATRDSAAGAPGGPPCQGRLPRPARGRHHALGSAGKTKPDPSVRLKARDLARPQGPPWCAWRRPVPARMGSGGRRTRATSGTEPCRGRRRLAADCHVAVTSGGTPAGPGSSVDKDRMPAGMPGCRPGLRGRGTLTPNLLPDASNMTSSSFSIDLGRDDWKRSSNDRPVRGIPRESVQLDRPSPPTPASASTTSCSTSSRAFRAPTSTGCCGPGKCG